VLAPVVVAVLVALLLVVLAPVVLVGVVGARRLRLRLPLLPIPLEVRPGHPSATHGQGASRCGHFRVRGGPRPQLQPTAMFTSTASLFAPSWTPPAQPSQPLTWPGGWDQAVLAQSFSTMGLTPQVSTEWIADSGASFHTTQMPVSSALSDPTSSM